ncbi:MAG: hypothetical protein NVV59_14500 [Chitinophagaceae bacterium]|nr:hypothetical protein [Chitinophagaceae bacterium]
MVFLYRPGHWNTAIAGIAADVYQPAADAKNGSIRKDGFDFISITRMVSNSTMGQKEKNSFTQEMVDSIRQQPFIEDVAPLEANLFQVELSAGGILPFSTNLFVESIEDRFLDTLPPNFGWQPGQSKIPVIVSSDFLEIFNVFGPSYGLPQVSPETASGIPVFITVSGDAGREETFAGQIVAFSDRINSVIVPKSFLDWGNVTFKGKKAAYFSRLYLKTKDANDPALLSYLDANGFKVNKDKTKFGRMKQVFEGIFTGLGVFGILVVILALLLFSFYLQLVIARSRESIRLLLMLGYSPNWLSVNFTRRFIPVYIGIIVVAVLLIAIMQYVFHQWVMYNRPELESWPHWSVALVAVALLILSIVANFSLVKKRMTEEKAV